MRAFRKFKRYVKQNMNNDSTMYKIIEKVYKKLSSIKYEIVTNGRILFNKKTYEKRSLKRALKEINKNRNNTYIVLYNPTWLGVANSTKGLFNSNIPLEEITKKKLRRKLINSLKNTKIESVIFSQVCTGWTELIKELKDEIKDMKIKVIWHANNFEVDSDFTWGLNKKVIDLYKKKYVNALAFVKKSMAEFYKQSGYNAYYFLNTVKPHTYLKSKPKLTGKEDLLNEKINIGVYNAHSRDLKNIYTQILSATLFKDAKIDIVPSSDNIRDYCEKMEIEYTDKIGFLPIEKLMERIQKNDINIYATFTECSPMFPLESFEAGVPCLIGNNNDYFMGSKLRDYVCINREDDPQEIYERIMDVLNNKEEVMNLYKEWKKEFDKSELESITEFINA